jgi:hypothetical protein
MEKIRIRDKHPGSVTLIIKELYRPSAMFDPCLQVHIHKQTLIALEIRLAISVADPDHLGKLYLYLHQS